MKINAKRITAVLMAAAMSVCATTAAFAASTTDTPVVDENHATADTPWHAHIFPNRCAKRRSGPDALCSYSPES